MRHSPPCRVPLISTANSRWLTKDFGILLLAVAVSVLTLGSCRSDRVLPSVRLDLSAPEDMKITDWQVLGPFAAEKSKGAQGAQSRAAALDRDFLLMLGSSETEINASSFSQIDKGFINWFRLPSGFRNLGVHAADGVIRLDKVFPNATDVVSYAACVIESPIERELVLVTGADDSAKVWLNGKFLVRMNVRPTPGQPAYGNLGKAASFTTASLNRGRNFLLIKVPQIERMWGFNCSLLDLEAARRLAQKNEAYMHDLVAGAVVRQGAALMLDPYLAGLMQALKLQARLEILDSQRRLVSTDEIDYRSAWTKSLEGFKQGLYSCRFTWPLYSLNEPFYYGDAEHLMSSFPGQYASLKDLSEEAKLGFEALLIRQAHLLDPANRQSDEKVWQAKIVYLISEFGSLLSHVQSEGASVMVYPGTHLRGFKSGIDNQVQYYMVHVPDGYAQRKGSLPLVVFVPFPLPNTSFLKSVLVANTALLDTYVKLADKYGYALLWPFARGNVDAAPIAVTDIFEALKAAGADYDFDQNRIYLFGWSYGATYALLLGERFPGLFAAIGAIMPPTDLVAFEQAADEIHSPYPVPWLRLNSPVELVESLSNTPLYLIQGDEDKTVPLEQTINFATKCRQLGFDPKLDIIPGMDHVYSPVDPILMLFEFFKDKALIHKPQKVSIATGQIKHGSAFWLKIDRLIQPLSVGRLTASVNRGRIQVKADNVSSYTILLDRLEYGKDTRLTVETNDQVSFSGIPPGKTIRIDLNGSSTSEPDGQYKNQLIEGPISHAFAGSFLLVKGTTGSAESQTALDSLTNAIRGQWRKNYAVDCGYKNDRDVTPQDIKEKHLVLLGNAETNSLIAKVLPAMPVQIAPDHVSLGDRRFEGQHLGVQVIYPNPMNRDKYIIIIGANDLSLDREIENNLAQKGWFDFVVWDSGNPQKLERLAAGYWDWSWRKIETTVIMR